MIQKLKKLLLRRRIKFKKISNRKVDPDLYLRIKGFYENYFKNIVDIDFVNLDQEFKPGNFKSVLKYFEREDK